MSQSSITFEVFKDKFNEIFKEKAEKNLETPTSQFIIDFENGENPLNAELKKDETTDNSDSYGYTDETYTKVFYFPEFDIYIKFNGWKRSYDGSGWYDLEEVKPVTKTIETYE